MSATRKLILFVAVPLVVGLLWAAAPTARAASATDRCVFFASPEVPADSKDARVRRLAGPMNLEGEYVTPQRGTLVVRLNAKAPFGGFPAYLEIYPGPPHVTFRCSGKWPKDKDGNEDKTRLQCSADIVLRYCVDSNVLESFDADKGVLLTPGEDLHVAWTWAGVAFKPSLRTQL